MAATDYLTVSAFKASRGVGDYTDDGLIADAITSASRTVDNITGRTFYRAASATLRHYLPPTASDTLYVDDIADTTGLIVVDYSYTLTLGTNFVLLPADGFTFSGEAGPYYQIRKLYGVPWYSVNGNTSVSVTAIWGWPSVPPLVARATSVLAADLLAGDRTRFGVLNVGDIVMRARANPQVMDMLATYVRTDTKIGIA
jgi:hypothetical protein